MSVTFASAINRHLEAGWQKGPKSFKKAKEEVNAFLKKADFPNFAEWKKRTDAQIASNRKSKE